MNIVILDGFSSNPGDISWEPLKQYGKLTVYERTKPDEVIERVKDAEIVITNKVAFDANTIAQLPKLQFIAVLATGYNIIDCAAAHKQGVIVSNVPAYSTMSVAQMVFAHILNIYNHVSHYADENRAGRWSKNDGFCYWDTSLQELDGKTIGIVGLGNIGSRVAKIAIDFGMKVIAFTSKSAESLPEGITKATTDELFAASDIITLHCPLTPDTHELVNSRSIAKMKKSAIVINTGRGPLVNEADIAAALTNKQLAAYGADVMVSEPPAADNPLFKCPNAFITPHIAWATLEARKRLLDVTFQNVKAFLNGKPQNVVN
jgi:glycerate dehydrogenase